MPAAWTTRESEDLVGKKLTGRMTEGLLGRVTGTQRQKSKGRGCRGLVEVQKSLSVLY